MNLIQFKLFIFVMGFGSNRKGGASTSTIKVVYGHTEVSSDFSPSSDTVHSLGKPSQRWSNVYTGDLHLKNERGDWTIFEEADKLVVKNNLTGELFSLMLEKIEK
tara:strand:- start:1078 stop:1392 length:315 start_codon:yes stop_codon:yes gene_type:complete